MGNRQYQQRVVLKLLPVCLKVLVLFGCVTQILLSQIL